MWLNTNDARSWAIPKCDVTENLLGCATLYVLPELAIRELRSAYFGGVWPGLAVTASLAADFPVFLACSASRRSFSAWASWSVKYRKICTRPGYCSEVSTRLFLSMV